MKLKENNLSGAVNELRAKGYEDDFKIKENHIISTKSGKILQVQDFEIETGFQFEIEENAVDSQYLFTIIEQATGNKGLLIDLMGTEYFGDKPVNKKLQVPMDIYVCEAEPVYKYGVRKVLKEEFNTQPDRYELREDFPDFPNCPFDNHFTILGFDKKNQEYVWLVTSILRDKRLKKISYQP
jgi:hypothetical protein